MTLLVLQSFLIIQMMFKNGFNIGKKYVKFQHFRLISKLEQNFVFKTLFLFSLIEIHYLSILIKNT